MSKIIRLSLVFTFIASFLTVPIFYYFINTNTHSNNNVKGASIVVNTDPGVTVNIESTLGNWDMYKFLCTTINECTSSLNNGKPWGIVSGGTTDSYVYNLDLGNNVDSEYKYLKVYVRSSWGSILRVFEPSVRNLNKDIQIFEIKNDLNDYKAVVMPVELVKSTESSLIEFKDY